MSEVQLYGLVLTQCGNYMDRKEDGAYVLATDYYQLRGENKYLRGGMTGDYDLDAWLDWCKERDELRTANQRLDSALKSIEQDYLRIIDAQDEKHREQVTELKAEVARLRQHKNEYMDAAEVTRKALLREITAMKTALSQAVEYLEVSAHEQICSGSVLHQRMKAALAGAGGE